MSWPRGVAREHLRKPESAIQKKRDIRIDDVLFKKARQAAFDAEMSLSEFVRRALRAYLWARKDYAENREDGKERA